MQYIAKIIIAAMFVVTTACGGVPDAVTSAEKQHLQNLVAKWENTPKHSFIYERCGIIYQILNIPAPDGMAAKVEETYLRGFDTALEKAYGVKSANEDESSAACKRYRFAAEYAIENDPTPPCEYDYDILSAVTTTRKEGRITLQFYPKCPE